MPPEIFLLTRLTESVGVVFWDRHHYWGSKSFALTYVEGVRRVRHLCPEVAGAAAVAADWVMFPRYWDAHGYIWQAGDQLESAKRLHQAIKETGLFAAESPTLRIAYDRLAECVSRLPPKQYLALTTPRPHPRRRRE